MTECKHLLEAGTCSLCNGNARQVAQPPEGIIEARYSSRCGFCDNRIHEGASIGLIDGEWIHLNHFKEDL